MGAPEPGSASRPAPAWPWQLQEGRVSAAGTFARSVSTSRTQSGESGQSLLLLLLPLGRAWPPLGHPTCPVEGNWRVFKERQDNGCKNSPTLAPRSTGTTSPGRTGQAQHSCLRCRTAPVPPEPNPAQPPTELNSLEPAVLLPPEPNPTRPNHPSIAQPHQTRQHRSPQHQRQRSPTPPAAHGSVRTAPSAQEGTKGSWQPQGSGHQPGGAGAGASTISGTLTPLTGIAQSTPCSAPALAPVEQEGTDCCPCLPPHPEDCDCRHLGAAGATGLWIPPQQAWEGVQAAGDPLFQQGSVRGTGRTSLDWGWQPGSGTVPTMIPS